ncbi:phosphatidylglycerophosphatase [Vespertiliibacter pulmonis]|uniref:Phosphatidylglycerophosphatase A n=1 Tax=Vespertiliibacter pulmonis TaxID=1443036 RepID=A0A3N4WCN0_9PAST|nr:phosphatidylglycerophosphatase A [Vespertiliibacter pulmonis]QLB21108.1 phosphatidylglycerophosphatase [Vespertiliibacter pulmonis]RPE83790.1 phosphatidylglycerophosphatase A [Vespertiliibacter pulmonis]
MKINIKNPIHFLAVGFGSGLITPAPGTWGSLIGLISAIILWQLTASSTFFVVLTVLSFIFGCHICEKTSKDLGVHDDGRIVWDEIVALFFIFCLLPEYNWLYYLLTFGLFRLFDIWKPYPIKTIDLQLQNGFGIMFDDILAAIYTLISLYIIHWWI